MTTEELQAKLKNAKERVEKRAKTLQKLCNRKGLDFDKLIDCYRNATVDYGYAYLSIERQREIVKLYPDSHIINGEDVCSDVKDNLYKLYELEHIVKGWEEKVKKSIEDDNIIQIPVLVEFLNDWEKKCIDWYINNANHYFTLKQSQEKDFELYLEKCKEECPEITNKYQLERRFLRHYYDGIDDLTKVITDLDWDYKTKTYVSYKIKEDLLYKTIKEEKKRKYLDLVRRVEREVGKILDAQYLSIGEQNGELNGIIIGENGKCRVETISAEGPIQRFHYRVLVHKIKES